MHLTHTEVVEFRQRIAKANRLMGDAQIERMKLQQFQDGLVNKYNLQGLKAQFDPETGEIIVHPETVHYEPWQSAFHAEKATEGRNIWTEDEVPVATG